MTKNIDLASLVPKNEDRPTYTDYDLDTMESIGVYQVAMKIDFSPLDLVKLDDLYNMIVSTKSENGNKQTDKIKAKKLKSAYDGLFGMLIPGLSKERQDIVPFMIKRQFCDWWHEEMLLFEEDDTEQDSAELEAMTEQELADLGEESAN